MTADRISVIIPVLNEAATIADSLSHLQRAAGAMAIEVIVVDGGSQDGTRDQLAGLGITVLTAPPGRAHQMNAGAARATSNVLLFLHADTRLPLGFPVLVNQVLSTPGVIAGAFALSIDGDLPGLRWVEWFANWRSRTLRMPYGDQAIFLRAEQFHAIGGFPQQPIMEDYELIRRLRRRGQIAIVPQPVITSARRWQKLGVLQTTLINQAIVAAYRLGVSPQRLVRWYR
ncbi:MAG: TIGR04283 family arsenosugar biosynthesis glycosyltransferase [Cyanobacteria bacterium]|nr:TIGR04283 family arsenosugar biosynthesis glycosyltransferase [Cyanobacteriota bacterium]